MAFRGAPPFSPGFLGAFALDIVNHDEHHHPSAAPSL